jgi:ABC-type nitrate/sulfonate/bicarbonate transport system substrate-binding protein
MPMRPLGLPLAAATVLCTLLAACAGAPGGPSSAPAPARAAPAAAAEAPAAAPVAAAPPALATIRYGQVGASAATWPMFVAEAHGLLDREAVELDKVTFANGNAVVQALAAGSIDTASVGADLTVLAVEQGAALSIVGGGYNRLVYTLMAQPGISSVRDLAGKAVGVGGVKTSDALAVRRMLAHGGLKDDDYDLTAAATSNDRFAALRSGIISAAVLTQPFDFQAADEGFRLLARSTDVVPDYQFTALIANRPWAAQNEDALVRLVRAYAAAARWLQDPANKEQAITILVEATRTQEKYARQTYALYLEEVKTLTPDGAPNLPGIQTAIDLLGEAGDLNPPLPQASKFVDDSYLQKARAR